MAKRRRRQRYSGIGGQAVLEGVMMRNKSQMAVAVRKPDGEIEVGVDEYHGIGEKTIWARLPLVRGVLSFVDSLITGMKAMNFSSAFYDDENDSGKSPEKKEREEAVMTGITIVISLVLAVGIFAVLPVFLMKLMSGWIRSDAVMAILEGVIRLAIFLIYMIAVSAMKDIRRLYGYHGAEHKCINCIEHGLPLTVDNVRISSRQHKRCGTSFLFFVLAISIILLMLIQVESPLMRVIVRIALIPVIAGISYEVLKLAGRSENPIINLLSRPGLAIQKLTTKEPDDSMIEVAIQAVEAVFDWRAYEAENFKTAEDL